MRAPTWLLSFCCSFFLVCLFFFFFLFFFLLSFLFFLSFFSLEICPAKGSAAFSPYSLPWMLNGTHGKGAMAERKIKGGGVTQWPPPLRFGPKFNHHEKAGHELDVPGKVRDSCGCSKGGAPAPERKYKDELHPCFPVCRFHSVSRTGMQTLVFWSV